MKNFQYFRPSSPEAAVALLDKTWGTAELLGGGTDLLDLQKEYVAQPSKVISVAAIKGFDGISVLEKEPPVVVIGAGTKIATVASDSGIKEHFPALASAAGGLGTPQIRNMATLGGNLCQRNRCWYFRDEHVRCLLKGGDKCYALDGENRYHAIFTKEHTCVIVSPSTIAPALIAYGASAEVLGPKGKRTVKLAEFYRAPRKEGEREHVLEANELVLSVSIPAEKGLRSANYEVAQKRSYDWPMAQAVVAFHLDGKKAKEVRIILGHVAPTPLIADAAMKEVEGKEITEETAAKAGEAATEGAKPLKQNEYKLRLLAVAVKRALLTAAGAKKYWVT
ncbi:MAG: FAD binding domain-containing protein [Planctomycetes bacterium]|nr:FAD binding domain-containing protein [Planctomycetota bacterium]